MLAYVRGTLVAQIPGSVVVEMSGLALRLNVPTSLVEQLPPLGEMVKLHTHLHWREDGPQLYGFADDAELELFLKLITVSGIGPKVALAILSYAPPARLLVWLMGEDLAELRKIPGVGLKTAQRLILELKEKATALSGSIDLSGVRGVIGTAADTVALQALEALVSLGYDSNQAAKVLAEVLAVHSDAGLETMIREALRRLARF